MQQQPSVAALSPHSGSGLSLMSIAQREWPLLGSIATAAAFLFFGQRWLADLSNPLWLAFLLIWLFGVVLFSALAVVRHAEVLAVKLGEPLGTLVLTLSVAGIEIMMIAAIMYTAEGGSSLARDTMFAAVMIVINGMIGLSLLLGGLRYHEQTYNLQGANAFLAVIVPLAVLSLILPTFTTSSPGPTLSPFQAMFHIVMSVGLYGVFLAIQNLRHRNYFVSTDPEEAAAGPLHAEGEDFGLHTVSYHTLFLLMYLAPVIILSKQMAVPINFAIREWHAPSALGGLLVAVLILGSGVARRGACGPREPAPAIRQCAVGFRTGDDQSHHSGRPHHRVPHEQDHHPRTWSGRYDHAATDVGGQHFDIRQITNECFGRDCAPPVVFGLSHAHLRAVTLSGRFTSSGDDSGARPGSAEPGARQRVVLTRTRRLELCRGAGRLSLIGQVRRSD